MWELACDTDELAVVDVPVRAWHRVYSAHDTFETPNPGVGNTRFAPFPDLRTGTQVPTMYVADSLAAALLETVFHNVDTATGTGVVAHRDMHGRLHAQVLPPRTLRLADLRDQELSRLGVARSQVATSPAEHYACTRTVGQIMHACDEEVDGILWHSRQAEQQGFGQVEVAVMFCDRAPVSRKTWQLASKQDALGALLEGAGLTALNSIAVELGVTLSGDEF